MKHNAILALALVLVMATAATAQDGSSIKRGTFVRVTAPQFGLDGERRAFYALVGDTLLLDLLGTTRIPMPSVTKLEVRSGRGSGAGRGALVGGLLGGVVALIGSAASCEDSFVFSAGECVIVGTFTFAGLGALLGAGIGALTAADRWSEIPFESLAFGVTRDRGWAVSGSIKF